LRSKQQASGGETFGIKCKTAPPPAPSAADFLTNAQTRSPSVTGDPLPKSVGDLDQIVLGHLRVNRKQNAMFLR
jgi:hypothetical protein